MNNQVFNEMGKRLNAYERDCKDRPKYPLSDGESKAYRLWRWCQTDELVMDDHLWEREVHDFITTLRKAEVETFVFTCQSTALMENMHWFEMEGCRLVGLCKVKTGNTRYDFETKKYVPEVKKGVRFAL